MTRLLRHAVVAVGAALALSGGAVFVSQADAATAPPDWRLPGKVQAELPNEQHGVINEPTTDEDGGENAAYIGNGDWLEFNLTIPREWPFFTFVPRFASGARPGVTGVIELRFDTLDGPVLASVPVSNTGGWQSWKTEYVEMTHSVSGQHKVYLTFTSASRSDFVNVNWFGIH